MRRRPVVPGTVALLTAALLAACADGAQEAGPGAGEGLRPVTVGSMPIVDTAPLHLAIEEGIFADHGLDVEVRTAQGGAVIVPAVVSGEHEFGFSNVVSLLVGVSRGLDLQVVAPASASSGDTGADLSAVLTMPGSGIGSPADLAGRTVAVNTLGNIGEVSVSAVVEADGGDPLAVDFVELDFADMAPALTGGRVDAVWITEPFLTTTRDAGAEVVVFDYATVDPDMMIDAYFTTGDFAAEHPEVVEAFAAAMTEALELASADPQAARDVLPAYTDISGELAERIAMPRFPPEPNPDSVQLLADLARAHGVLPPEPQIGPDELLP